MYFAPCFDLIDVKDVGLPLFYINKPALACLATPLDEKLPVVPMTTEQSTTTAVTEDVWKDTTVFVPEKEDGTVVHVEVDQSTDAPETLLETTPSPLSTTPARDIVDHDTSGDNVENTTIKEEFINSNRIPGDKAIAPSSVSVNCDSASLNYVLVTVYTCAQRNQLLGNRGSVLFSLAFTILCIVPKSKRPTLISDVQTPSRLTLSQQDESDFEFVPEDGSKTRAGNHNNEITLGASEGGNLMERTEVLAGVCYLCVTTFIFQRQRRFGFCILWYMYCISQL